MLKNQAQQLCCCKPMSTFTVDVVWQDCAWSASSKMMNVLNCIQQYKTNRFSLTLIRDGKKRETLSLVWIRVVFDNNDCFKYFQRGSQWTRNSIYGCKIFMHSLRTTRKYYRWHEVHSSEMHTKCKVFHIIRTKLLKKIKDSLRSEFIYFTRLRKTWIKHLNSSTNAVLLILIQLF